MAKEEMKMTFTQTITRDEMKNKISMALKDPILQQGFEIICKNLAELEKDNRLLEQRGSDILKELLDKNKKCIELEQQIEKMKCCCNCDWSNYLPNGNCLDCDGKKNWKLKEIENKGVEYVNSINYTIPKFSDENDYCWGQVEEAYEKGALDSAEPREKLIEELEQQIEKMKADVKQGQSYWNSGEMQYDLYQRLLDKWEIKENG